MADVRLWVLRGDFLQQSFSVTVPGDVGIGGLGQRICATS